MIKLNLLSKHLFSKGCCFRGVGTPPESQTARVTSNGLKINIYVVYHLSKSLEVWHSYILAIAEEIWKEEKGYT